MKPQKATIPRARPLDSQAYWNSPGAAPLVEPPPLFTNPDFRGSARHRAPSGEALDPLTISYESTYAPRPRTQKRSVSFSLDTNEERDSLPTPRATSLSQWRGNQSAKSPDVAEADLTDQRFVSGPIPATILSNDRDLNYVDDEHRPSDATLVDRGSRDLGPDKLKDAFAEIMIVTSSIRTPGHSPFPTDGAKKKKSRTGRDVRRQSTLAVSTEADEAAIQIRMKQHLRRGVETDHRYLFGLVLEDDDPEEELFSEKMAQVDTPLRPKFVRTESNGSDEIFTGIVHDRTDYERGTHMAKEMKGKIFFHAVALVHRQNFLLTLAQALMKFGAPSHRNEAQLKAAARLLEVQGNFTQLPNIIICSFEDNDNETTETHWVRSPGRIWLGNLQRTHEVYRTVMHDEKSATEGATDLQQILAEPPLYSNLVRCIFAFWLSAMICPLAFGGSFLDAWVAGAGAFILCFLQLSGIARNPIIAAVFEVVIGFLMSFIARGLSSIPHQTFCYTSISSSSIIGILPGYLILSSSLELASKNLFCGSVRMVYALVYTLFLGFGLQVGSGAFLFADQRYRELLGNLADQIEGTTTILAQFVADNATNPAYSGDAGVFVFTDQNSTLEHYVVAGCFRESNSPWYLQPAPFWAQFFIVPLFSLISSLNNLQPLWGKAGDKIQHLRNLIIMVIISSFSFAANKIATRYIFDRSDIVSSIGAFTAGVMGNLYSRKMGGTAFTSMVTAVLFLVPSGLSAAGGITGNGDGIEIGGAMIAVTVGVTVGLFMSQALVYSFGSRKQGAVMSF